MPLQLRTHLATLLCALALLPAAHAGTLLVANKAEGTVTLLRSPGFEPIATLPVGEGPHEIALSPEGRRALVANYGSREAPGNTLTLLDLVSLRPQATIELPEGSRPHGIEWVGNERALVTAEGLGALLLIDVQAAAVSARIAMEQDKSHMLAAARDGSAAWVANMGSGSVSAVDLRAGRKVADAASGAGAEGIALVNGGRELWVSNREAGTVTVFSSASLRQLAQIDVGGFPIRVEADDQRGRVYVTLAVDDALAVLDAADYTLLRRIPLGLPPDPASPPGTTGGDAESSVPVGLLLSRDGKLLFVAHTAADRISVHDAGSLEQLKVFAAGREPDGMAWTWVNLPVRQ